MTQVIERFGGAQQSRMTSFEGWSFEQFPVKSRFLALTWLAAGSLYLRVCGMAKEKTPTKPGSALLIGVGLDGQDGHKRLTTGKNFALVGGSQETHEEMTEKAIKVNEHLARRGRELHEVSREEFDEIAGAVGLHRPKPEQN